MYKKVNHKETSNSNEISMKRLKKALFLLPVFGIVLIMAIFFNNEQIETLASEYTGDLGTMDHYNGVVFGNWTSYQADIEGAIAVGGDYAEIGIMEYQGFDIGAAYEGKYPTVQMGNYQNPGNKYPSALLNVDNINLGAKIGQTATTYGWYSVTGGKVVMSEKAYNIHNSLPYKFDGGWPGSINSHHYMSEDKLDAWFDEQYELTVDAMNYYQALSQVTLASEDFANGAYFEDNDPSKYEVSYEDEDGKIKKALVMTVETKSNLQFSSRASLVANGDWAVKYDLVVINFPDAIAVSNGSDLGGFSIEGVEYANINMPPAYVSDKEELARRDAVATKYVYNFPNAVSINLESTYIGGSIIAPEADFHGNGGSVNGQLVCKNFVQEGGFELHAYNINRDYYDQVDPDFSGSDHSVDVEVTKYLYYKEPRDITLADAEYQLWVKESSGYVQYMNSDGTAYTFTTDAYGQHLIKQLAPGEYKLVETKPPDNGVLGTDPGNPATYSEYEFIVPDAGETVSDSDYYSFNADTGVISIKRYNEPELHEVTLKKTNGTNEIPGAYFDIYRDADAYFERTRVAANVQGGSSVELPFGTYHLVEVQAPDGYERITGDISFTIDGDGTISLGADYGGEATLTDKTLTIVNKAGDPETLVIINKVDAENENLVLEGAEFALYREESSDNWVKVTDNGSSVHYQNYDKIITDENGRFEFFDLPPGNYKLVETAAPEGYVSSGKEIAFTVAETESGTGTTTLTQSILIENEKARTEVQIVKTSDQGVEPAGAEFVLYRVNGSVMTKVTEVTTDATGIVSLGSLEAGSYELHETKTLDGHEEGSIVKFKVVTSGSTINVELDSENDSSLVSLQENNGIWSLHIENTAITGEVKIVKRSDKITAESGTTDDKYILEYLEGAEFTLQRKNSNGTYEDYRTGLGPTEKAGEKDEFGTEQAYILVENLPLGEYRIVEETYPDGYEAHTGEDYVGSFVITEKDVGEDIEIVVVNEKSVAKSSIKVQKVDKDSGEGLAQTEFRLWEITEGAEDWTRDITIDEIGAAFDKDELKLVKYAGGADYITNADGWLELAQMEPGIYALAEIEPPEGYMFVLDERSTLLGSAFSLDYYYHTIVFKVVAVDENDISKGTRIQWVHEPKIETDEARFNNELHDTDSWSADDSWAEFGDEKDDVLYDMTAYRSFQITNRKVVMPEIQFKKVDADSGEPLEGAEFTLYAEPAEAGSGFSEEVGIYISDPDGMVTIDDLNKKFISRAKNSDLTVGRFMLEETAPPDGYKSTTEPFYFELVIDPMTKGLVMNELNADGTVKKEEYFVSYQKPEEPGTKGTYSYTIELPEVKNTAKKGQLEITKQLTEKATEEETFIFMIQRKVGEGNTSKITETFYASVTLEPGEDEKMVTIADLKQGTYVVTELQSNWRFELDTTNDENLGITAVVSDTPGKAVFTNKKSNDKWLSGKDKVTNTMKDLETE